MSSQDGPNPMGITMEKIQRPMDYIPLKVPHNLIFLRAYFKIVWPNFGKKKVPNQILLILGINLRKMRLSKNIMAISM